MYLRLIIPLLLALASVTSPIFGGIITGTSQIGNDEFRSSSGTSSTDEKKTPWQTPQKRLSSAIAELGMTVNVVSPVNNSQVAIGYLPAIVFNATPPLESLYSLSEWQFRPNIPVFKIPKVPII